MPFTTIRKGYKDEKDRQGYEEAIDKTNRIINNNLKTERLESENESLRKEVKSQPKTVSRLHSADNPDTGIGTKDKEWKNHKWVARKRGPNGKWIYDYGYGFGVKDPSLEKRIRDNEAEIASLKSESRNTGRTPEQSAKDKAKKAIDDTVENAKKAVGDTAENVRKTAEDTVSNAKKAVDELLKRLRHTAIIGEDYLEHSDLMDIPVAVINSIDDTIEG